MQYIHVDHQQFKLKYYVMQVHTKLMSAPVDDVCVAVATGTIFGVVWFSV